MRNRILLATLLLICSLFTSTIAQEQSTPLPDRWRSLVIDESSPVDAIRALGRPTKDKQQSPRTYPLNKRVRFDFRTKGIRELSYENIEGADKARLYFKDDKLILIDIDLKEKLPATSFPNIYGIEFWPKVSEINQSLEPREYERNEGRVYPKNYPDSYYLIATTDKTYVSAAVDNGGVGQFLLGSKRSKMGDDDKGGFPGKVGRIQIISRKFEKDVGADALR